MTKRKSTPFEQCSLDQANQGACEVPLAEQNAFAIKRLEEAVNLLLRKDATPQLGYAHEASLQGAGAYPTKGINSNPTKIREVPDVMNGLRMRISDLEDIVSGLVDRLGPYSSSEPPTAVASGTSPTSYSTEAANTVYSLQCRVQMQVDRLRSLIDRVQL